MLGCAAVLVLGCCVSVIAVALLGPQLVNVIVGAIGLEARGQTTELFNDITPEPTFVLNSATEPESVQIDVGTLGQETLSNDNPTLYSYRLGYDARETRTLQIVMSEDGVNELCRQRTTACSEDTTNSDFRNVRIDLRPGGAVVYFDYSNVSGNASTQLTGLGLVMTWDQTARRLRVQGVDFAGALFGPGTNPQNLPFPITFEEVEQRVNEALASAAATADGRRYQIVAMTIRESDLVMTLQ